MESRIVRNLRPEFDPVAVIWSDVLPENTFQFKEGKFGCILYLFAEASRNGRIAGGSRRTVACPGGRAALGFGNDFLAALDRNAALLSKGLACATDLSAYRARMEAVPRSWRDLYQYGERRHATFELARDWILRGLPVHDVPRQFVLFKPLGRVAPEDDLRAVIFPLNPVELGGLITLAGSVMPGTDPIQAPQGPDCTSITAFAYAQAESKSPRAILGTWGVDGREVMHKRFRDDVLTLTLPAPLFHRLEQEADDCIFQTPSWKGLTG